MTTEDDHPWPRCNSQNFGLAAARPAHAPRLAAPTRPRPRRPGAPSRRVASPAAALAFAP